MKNQKSLVSLLLVFGLLFCLAFACKDDNAGETGSDRNGKSKNQTATRDDSEDESVDSDSGGNDPGGTTTNGLPAGTYACFTTVQIYAGQGGSGSSTYPIYNYSRQTRGEINVESDGTYSVGGTSCHYSYDAATNSIQWQDCAFAQASSSQLTTDDKGNQQIMVKFNGDKDVWDCTKQ